MYRFALRLTGSPDDAKDLTQATFLRAYEAWDRYTPGTQCRSWLFTVGRNLFLRERERRRRHDEIVEGQLGPPSAAGAETPLWAAPRTNPATEFFESVLDETILDSINDLGEEFRSALWLSDVEGLSYREIADLMDAPVGTIKSRLFRARRQLKKALYDYAVESGHVLPD